MAKQYISIIRLFNHCGIPAGDDYNSSRARKQLQAEFSIAQEGFIEIDGYVYTRQYVFDEIEQPDFEKRLSFHREIWEDAEMLDMLENNSVNVYTIGESFKPFWNNEEFDNFFSPFFVGPFQYISRVFLTEHKLRELGDWLAYEGFLQPAEREEAFRPIRIFLDENERLLRNVNRENYKIMRAKILYWVNSSWHFFFNNLPHEFYDIRTDFIFLFINLTVSIQHSHKKDCLQISEQLITLKEVPDDLRPTIISNHKIYAGKDAPLLSFRGGWWIIWLAIMAIRIVTCGSDSERKSPGYDIKPFENNRLLLLDTSIYKRDSIIIPEAPVIKFKKIP